MNDEHFDRAVGRAMEQVPLPLGLAERLLATLQAADGQLAEANRPAQGSWPVEGSRPADGSRLAEKNRRVVSRRWLVPASIAAAALVAVFGWFVFRPVYPPMGYEDVIADVGDFYDQEAAAEGQPLAVVPSADFPLSSAVVTNSSTRWRPVSKLLGRSTGVAYELTSARGKRATLYVVDLNSRHRPIATNSLPSSPPNNGIFTEGRTMGAWSNGTQLYVLVVEGDDRDYRGFLRRRDHLA